MGRGALRRLLRRGSKKGHSRRHLEGRSLPFREYDPVGVCPRFTGNGRFQFRFRRFRFCTHPDPPILAFFDFLAFFVFRFSLVFCAFFLSFPRILGVPRREKHLLFLGKNPCFFQKSKDWRVRAVPGKMVPTAPVSGKVAPVSSSSSVPGPSCKSSVKAGVRVGK